MRSILKWSRPSPTLIIALIAMFAALGGTVYAANRISGKSIKRNSLPGNRIKKNSVTGKQIKESSLGTVPNATAAKTVGGLTVTKFFVKVPNGTGPTTLIDTGLVTLAGSCAGGNHAITVTADSGAPSLALNYTTSDTATNTVTNNGFNAFSNATVTTPAMLGSIGHLIAAATSGKVSEVQYMGRDAPNWSPAENACVFAGVASTG